MVRIDARYAIPFPRQLVWEYLSDPEREAEYGWLLLGERNRILERGDDFVVFEGGREGAPVPGGSVRSTFHGKLDRKAFRIDWEIIAGFEAGSRFSEQLERDGDGTVVHVSGEIALAGFSWWRWLMAVLRPRSIRARIEANLCRDYKALKLHLRAQD